MTIQAEQICEANGKVSVMSSDIQNIPKKFSCRQESFDKLKFDYASKLHWFEHT